MVNKRGNIGSSNIFCFLGLKIIADGDCSHEIKRCLFLGREAMSPVAYWAPTDLGRSSFSVIPFYLFILFVGLRQEYQSGLPFPSPVHHVLSELFTMTHLCWVPALEGRFSTTGPPRRFWADLKGENAVILMEVRTH